MKFTKITFSTLFIAATLANPSTKPFVLITRYGGTTSLIGGSIACFGTKGRVKKADVTSGYQATLYSDYSCKGTILGYATGNVEFEYPIDTKSISLSTSVN